MPITALSPCIVLEILDLIRYDETRSFAEQSRDLSSVALTCRLWKDVAQQLLFRNVQLTTRVQVASFLSTSLKLRSAVRQLKITIVASDDLTSFGIPESDLAVILASTPRLYELDLNAALASLSATTLASMRKSCPKPPTALRCTNALQRSSHPVRFPYQLASEWAESLEFLVLGGDQFCFLDEPPLVLPPFTGTLKEFRWTGFDSPSKTILDWFLGQSAPTLLYLSLDALPEASAFSRLLERHGPALRSLRLRDLFGVRPESLNHCTALEEFILDRGMDEFVLDILASSAPGLSHVEFGVRVKAASSESLEAATRSLIEKGGLSHLKVITIKQWGGTWSLAHIVKKWRAALPKGVEVVDGSPMKRTPLQRRKSMSKITNLFDAKDFPRMETSAVYRFMSRSNSARPRRESC